MLTALKNEMNVTSTENGAKAFNSTKSDLLDFFAQGGALRSRDEKDIVSMFTKAFAEDNLLALKALFYFRDVRGGQGERRTFRTILRYMADFHPEAIEKNIALIPYYGRYDDLYELFGTKLESKAGELIKAQFEEDLEAEQPSLLGKWLKSENASSYETKKLARKTREILGLTPREYRKSLSSLRKKINIVESLLTEKKWEEIEYSKLPSKAGMKYRQAFYRNDGERYAEFLDSVTKGESKINASTLFPYEIVREVKGGSYYWGERPTPEDDAPLNAMWENLPDYVGENGENSIAVVDVSGSMTGLPMDVAVSVGLYLAERNKGAFHNHFLTFSSRPQLVEVKGSTFCERVRNIKQADWAMDTNIEAVFNLVLNTAIKNKVSKEEMVKKLYIISDMEFNRCTEQPDETIFHAMKEKFAEHGYDLPLLVFWNVDARNDHLPVTMDDNGTYLVSGCSPSLFKNVMNSDIVSPYEMMLEVLNDERYNLVAV